MNKAKLFSIRIWSLLLLVNCLHSASLKAQTPTTCLEIESILADACGSPEGENEMVRFKIGPAAIAVSNLNVSWPNNSFQGISPVNTTTTTIVNALNATILGCGRLVQPVSGMLPAGKTVLLISSTNVSLSANSFANLTDTLYVIFQNAGNTAGHFVNYNSSPGLRTLTISRISPAPACQDVVTYDRALLINQLGAHGGSSAINDGATIEFSWAGTANYINNGCQAPFVANTSHAGANASMCSSGTLSLNGTATGNYSGVIWQGGAGSFSNPNQLSTTYTASPSDAGTITLSLGVTGNCGDTVFSSMTVTILPAPVVTITASGSTTFCQGGTVTLSASGDSSYSWSTGATGNSITVSASGTYTVTATNSCGTQTATQIVTVNPAPTAAISTSGSSTICAGDSVTLYASGLGNFSWSTGATTDSITVFAAGTYTLTSANSCGSQQATQVVNMNPLPSAAITAAGSTTICTGDSVTLNAVGTGSYLWSTGSTANSITVSAAGTYTLTVTNSCGSQTATQAVTVNTTSSVTIHSSAVTFCAGSSLLLYATGAGSFLWTGGSSNDSLVVTAGGTYFVTATSSCGTATDTITVTELALPVANITTTDPPVACPGSPVTLYGSGGTSYLWLPSGASGSMYSGIAPGTYTLIATNSCGSSTDTITITALPPGAVGEITAVSTTICNGGAVTLTGTATNATYFMWSTGETSPTITVSAAGTYYLTISNSCGGGVDVMTITADSVEALFTPDTFTGTAPLTVDFTNNSSPSATGFLWDLGNGTTTGTASPSTTYSVPGTYIVTLTVVNAAGCSDSYSVIITVTDEIPSSTLVMPNVFTPNSDALNDTFGASGFGIDQFNCSIYDRWGILMTELKTFNSGWDGRTTSGAEASDGTYFYMLKAKGLDGKEYDEKGYLQLIRK